MRGILEATVIPLVLCSLSCAGEGERFAEGELLEADSVTWLDVEPIFTAECAGCHDDPPKLGAPQALKTYEEVIPWLNRIKVRSLEVVTCSRWTPRGGG